MEHKNSIGEKLHSLRLQKEYSIDDLRRMLANFNYPASNKTIYRWERNEVIPDLKAITILCEIYKITVSYLMNIKHNDRTQIISKYETQFLYAFRTNEIYRKLINSVLRKEVKRNVTYWQEIKDIKEGE